MNIVKLQISTFCRDLTAHCLRGNVPAKTDVCTHASGADKSDEPIGVIRIFTVDNIIHPGHDPTPRLPDHPIPFHGIVLSRFDNLAPHHIR